MSNILVRPRFDEATQYSFEFAQQILDWCRQANIPVLDMPQGDAVRSKVELAIREQNPEVFAFYDHGNETGLIGQDEQPVIDLTNCSLLAGREVYTMACLSAKELGRRCYDLGAKYWGYKEVVAFTTDALDEFKESLNCGFRYRFVEGSPPAEALTRAKETFTELASSLMNQGKVFAAATMTGNRDALRYYNGEKPEEEPEGCLVALLKLPFRLLRKR